MFLTTGPAIRFVEFDPAVDTEALVGFLSGNTFPFHARPVPTPEQARSTVDEGRFWSDDSVRALTDLVFTRWPAVAYAVLRRDRDSGVTTPVVWDDR